jgi:chromosome segregation ATPase
MTQIEDQIKSQLASLKSQEQDRANDLAEAESRLTKEQDALSSIQDQLNAVVKKLQPAASQ